jgi:hypothetical protein
VTLDGVLFDDLSFFGPNRLNSRRSMTVWELEARRDRRYFREILEARGPEVLQQEMLASLARQAERPRIGMQVARRGRATNVEGGREVRFAFLGFPGAPVEALSGSARFGDYEAVAPTLEIRNRSPRSVRHLEMGWIFKDDRGREFLAGSIPADVELAPGGTSRVSTGTALRFSQPLRVESVSGFVSHVEFAGGEVWIPSRADLAGLKLDALVAPSPEEQRLANLYVKRGLKALVEELKRLQ